MWLIKNINKENSWSIMLSCHPCSKFSRPYQFTIAEEVNAVSLERSSILGPGEPWDGVTLDRGRDPQLLAFVDGHVAHGTSEGWGRAVDSFFGPGLDGNGRVGPNTKQNIKKW